MKKISFMQRKRMYMSEESKIAPTIVVLFSFPGFRFTDKVLHYLIFGASYTKKKLVFLSLPKKSFTYTYCLIFGASYTKEELIFLSLPKKSFTYTYGLIFCASYTKKKQCFLLQKCQL